MSQLDIASHGITDSIYPINAGMPISISHQGTPVHLRLYPITKQPLKGRPAPGCHQHRLSTCRLLIAFFVQIGDRHAASLAADSLNLAGGLNHRPQLFQLHSQPLGNFLLHRRQNMLRHFHYSHLAAQIQVNRGTLHANDAAPDNHQGLKFLAFPLQQVIAGIYATAVTAGDRRHGRL